VEHVCTILTKEEVARYITRGRGDDENPDEMDGLCDYGAAWAQVLVYSGPDAEARFDRLLQRFKQDKETRHPMASLGSDGWVIYPHPDNEYQPVGAFTHARVGSYVVSVFIDADKGKPAESAKDNAEAVTKIVLARLR